MDSATSTPLVQTPSSNNQTNNPQALAPTNLQPQPTNNNLGVNQNNIADLLRQSNQAGVPLAGDQTAVLQASVDSTTPQSSRPFNGLWLGLLLIVSCLGLVLVFGLNKTKILSTK